MMLVPKNAAIQDVSINFEYDDIKNVNKASIFC